VFGKPVPAQIRSIAVLPLRNLSGDPAQDYFADGVTEAMTTEFANSFAVRLNNCRVYMLALVATTYRRTIRKR